MLLIEEGRCASQEKNLSEPIPASKRASTTHTHLGFPLARPLYTSDGEFPKLVARVHRAALALSEKKPRAHAKKESMRKEQLFVRRRDTCMVLRYFKARKLLTRSKCFAAFYFPVGQLDGVLQKHSAMFKNNTSLVDLLSSPSVYTAAETLDQPPVEAPSFHFTPVKLT